MRLPVTARTTLLRELRDEVRGHYPRGRVVIAVDGADPVGAAAFADGLAEVFAEDGLDAFRASLDGFRRPRGDRDRYDVGTLRRVLIDPFRDGRQAAASIGFQLEAWDAERDAPVEARWVTGPEDAVLVVDGAFAHRPDLRGLWNWSVWLDEPRGSQSGRQVPDTVLAVYERDERPRSRASAIIDNRDPASPRRALEDFC
ncbi:uridine kinase [Microbacterium sp. LRZ72]|uniref:uridine kinase n=1 Tax=Microbacterium sp. LRZ72 TaxID=2942481 RepID=UPI0029B7494D|nr:uridine kinase [Microbacterium sp. LRZ72]MDX2377394.1 uridine kinase [Microbacterium sp. LRZ72]